MSLSNNKYLIFHCVLFFRKCFYLLFCNHAEFLIQNIHINIVMFDPVHSDSFSSSADLLKSNFLIRFDGSFIKRKDLKHYISKITEHEQNKKPLRILKITLLTLTHSSTKKASEMRSFFIAFIFVIHYNIVNEFGRSND